MITTKKRAHGAAVHLVVVVRFGACLPWHDALPGAACRGSISDRETLR
jgi:hypothetical protein